MEEQLIEEGRGGEGRRGEREKRVIEKEKNKSSLMNESIEKKETRCRIVNTQP